MPPPAGAGDGDAAQDAPPEGAPADAASDAAGAAGEGGDEGGGGSGDAGGTDAPPDGGPADAGVDVLVPDGEGGLACAAFDAGGAPSGTGSCGDGWRDPASEECDDGLGQALAARRACSSQCRVLDELAVWTPGPDGGLSNAGRTLGAGRHPVAASDATFGVVYLEPSSDPPTVSLATFGAKGAATGIVAVSSAPTAGVDGSNPVVAGLPCGLYAVAWADYDAEGGDELDVALRLVDPSGALTSPTVHANATTAFSQFDPDVLWTGSELVVAWVDTSNPATQPDVRFRTYDASLHVLSAEQTLAGTADSEADVALAAFGTSWAAAWRDDAGGMETVQVQTGGTTWTVGPAFLPAPVAAKPALTALDGTHLLVVYAVGADDADSGVANGSQVWAAVIDTTAAEAVTTMPLSALVAVGLDQSQPNVVSIPGGATFVSWWTAAAPGDDNGEELWLKQVQWSGATLDLTAAEWPLPRSPQARVGDQRSPAMAISALPPGGALVTGWDDLGGGIARGEGSGDVVVELIPAPPLRLPGDAGP
jgi:hypothetical protein